MNYVFAALTLGFLGSLHCIGMCGPIAMALPLARERKFKQWVGAAVYNAGRAGTYGLLGMLFGLLGKGFVIVGFQQTMSIALGMIILLSLLLPVSAKSRLALTPVIAPLILKVKTRLGDLLKQKKLSSLFMIGILNGFLPCGLVYLAVAGAIATGDAFKGGIFMVLFGVGTLPAMLFVSIASQLISSKSRSLMRRAVPVFAGIMACILILRGMNLDIPYLSPAFSKKDCMQHSCCHKN
jgi:uncharacterized protein